MLQIDDTLVSLELITRYFCCDVAACGGACCEEGDSGAPITDDEVEMVMKDFEAIKEFMDPQGAEAVEKNGAAYLDCDNDLVTTLINDKQCAFAIKKDGVWSCAIERAYEAGKSALRKPISCSLYPVRVTPHRDFVAVEYHRWIICKAACDHGRRIGLPLYKFLKEPLIARFGKEWYEELELVAEEYVAQGLGARG